MIEGFRIELTSEELLRHLDTRIESHRARASECDATRLRLEAAGDREPDLTGLEEEDAMVICWPGRIDELEQRAARYRRRAVSLVFLREHVVAGEIYRLAESDLRLLELWPPHAGAGVDA